MCTEVAKCTCMSLHNYVCHVLQVRTKERPSNHNNRLKRRKTIHKFGVHNNNGSSVAKVEGTESIRLLQCGIWYL